MHQKQSGTPRRLWKMDF